MTVFPLDSLIILRKIKIKYEFILFPYSLGNL